MTVNRHGRRIDSVAGLQGQTPSGRESTFPRTPHGQSPNSWLGKSGTRRWFAAFCCVLLSACSRGAKPITVHPVAGTLSVNGSPAANIIIHFVPDKGRPSTGITDAKGGFELRYEKDVPGAIPGVHKVWIEYRPATPAEEMAIREGKSPLSQDVQLALKKFGEIKTTPMTITIDGPQKDLQLKM